MNTLHTVRNVQMGQIVKLSERKVWIEHAFNKKRTCAQVSRQGINVILNLILAWVLFVAVEFVLNILFISLHV